MRQQETRPLRSRPTVSVVIPCFNYGHYLPTAVESVLGEREVDVEIIIVDDCSTDGSEQVGERLAAEHDNVRFVRNEKNLRLIGTATHGLSLVTGDYALLMSADDASARGALDRAAALLEANPRVGLAYGPTVRFSTERPPTEVPGPASHWTIWTGDEWARDIYASGKNAMLSPEVVVRVTTMREVGDYDPAFPHTSDLQMWLRFAAVSDIGFVAGSTQAYYRDHGANQHLTAASHESSDAALVDMRRRMESFESVQSLFREGPELLASARRRIARDALGRARQAYDVPAASRPPIAELVAFAEELDPSLRRTPAWVFFKARSLAGDSKPVEAVFGVYERLRDMRDQRRKNRHSASGLPR